MSRVRKNNPVYHVPLYSMWNILRTKYMKKVEDASDSAFICFCIRHYAHCRGVSILSVLCELLDFGLKNADGYSGNEVDLRKAYDQYVRLSNKK